MPTSGPTVPARVERLVVLIPVFNDWDSVRLLLPSLGQVLENQRRPSEVLLIDDGSTCPCDLGDLPLAPAIAQVRVLELARNLGHQRAIAIGLAYVKEHVPCDAVLVMDGDGEDDPQDVPRLLEKLQAVGGQKIVFAARTRRSEPWGFQFFYRLYQVLHLLLTGYRVRVGNFSVVPQRALARLVVVAELWNHYAAAVFNARIEYDTVPTARAKRLCGTSRMNFTSLVVHGLSALSVYSQLIGVRLLLAAMAMIAATLILLLGAFGLGLVAPEILPTWLPYAAGALLLILLQGLTAGVVFVLLVLAGRQGASFIPIRDYRFFVARVVRLGPSEE